MNSNRVKEIKKEDKKAFKSFIIIMIISAIAGGILGGMSIYFKDSLSDGNDSGRTALAGSFTGQK